MGCVQNTIVLKREARWDEVGVKKISASAPIRIMVPSLRRVHRTYFIVLRPYVVYSLYNSYFICLFEMGSRKIREIKFGKGTIPYRPLTAVDPAKRDAKRARIELAMLDFRAVDCQLTGGHHARLIEFSFWERAASPARDRAHPFTSRLGAT